MPRWLQILVTLTCVVVLATAADRAWREVESELNAAVPPQPGGIQDIAYTSVEAAHVTLTNMTHGVHYWCMKAIVTEAGGTGRVESVPVCSGNVEPHSTVSLIAPYPPGKVMDLCSSQGRYGREIDWSKCEFTTEEVKAP